MKNEVKNTSKDPNPEWLLGGNPNAIETQEKQGCNCLLKSNKIKRNRLKSLAF